MKEIKVIYFKKNPKYMQMFSVLFQECNDWFI